MRHLPFQCLNIGGAVRTATGQEMTRGEGVESARGVGMWTDLEAILVGRFFHFGDTVSQK